MGQPISKVWVSGATGFIGAALRPALVAAGYRVRASTRNLARAPAAAPGEDWVQADLLSPETLDGAMEGVDAAYYLVHSMGAGGRDYPQLERRSAQAFAEAAARHGLKRVIYLGGVAPQGPPSEHLASRLTVGRILREGRVPAVELRASMVVGHGSASWQIVRDLAFRLPAMVLPAWVHSRTRPIALQDTILALVGALTIPLDGSDWFDIPGPDVLSGRDILMKIAALRGRRIPAVSIPVLTPYLSAQWLRLITRADFVLARELVMGLAEDLLPRDERFWELTGLRPTISFDQAAQAAIAAEAAVVDPGSWGSALQERLVDLLGPKLKR
ncbi:MAG TPA: NAD(P)H-binding protein [Myxococcaceae bacterium]|nr:NAD(P)H-binding protein [Myxococcaceae bacterium]